MCKSIKLIALAFLLAVLVLNFAGFCWKQLRYLSDEEIMVVAVFGAQRFSSARNVVQTVEQAHSYVRSNPDCCSMLDWNDPLQSTPILNRIIGRAVFGVEVILPASKNIEGDTYYRAYVFIGCCGQQLGANGILTNFQ